MSVEVCIYLRLTGEHYFTDKECKYCDAVDILGMYLEAIEKHKGLPIDTLMGVELGLRTE